MVPSSANRAREATVSLGAEEAVGSDSQSNDEGCKHSEVHDVSEGEELRAPGDDVARDGHDARGVHSAHGDDDDAGGDRGVRGAGGVHVGAAPGGHDDGGAHGGHFDGVRGVRGADAHGDRFDDVRGAHFDGDHGAHDVGDDDAHDFGDVHGAGGDGCRGVDGGGAVRGATLSYRSDGVELEVATDQDILPEEVVGPGSGGRMPGTTRRNAAFSLYPVRGAVHQDRHGPIG